jgi:hypothetical protein
LAENHTHIENCPCRRIKIKKYERRIIKTVKTCHLIFMIGKELETFNVEARQSEDSADENNSILAGGK